MDELASNLEGVPGDRKVLLEPLATFMNGRLTTGEPIRLTFICTHNSRRSQMAQLWAATAGAYYGIAGVETYSGGTEVTAFNRRAVEAIARAGFAIEDPGGNNPHYGVRYSDNVPPIECFSKIYDDPFNPQSDFVAMITCSQADRACPVVRGCSLRVPIPYDDPKVADNRPEETATYDARCKQIGTEMLYLFSRVRI